jgi:hypothetical protein
LPDRENPLGQRQVDVYTGLNVMILLLELHRYAHEPGRLEQDQVVFYPSGQVAEEGQSTARGSQVTNDQLITSSFTTAIALIWERLAASLAPFLLSANLSLEPNLVSANLTGANLTSANLARTLTYRAPSSTAPIFRTPTVQTPTSPALS